MLTMNDDFRKDVRPNIGYDPAGKTIGEVSDLLETRIGYMTTKELLDAGLPIKPKDLDIFRAKYGNGVTIRVIDSKTSRKPGTLVDEMYSIQEILNEHPGLQNAIIASVENFCGSTVYRVYMPEGTTYQ